MDFQGLREINSGEWKTYLAIAEAGLTSLAIMVGGWWTWSAFIRKRVRWPHAVLEVDLAAARVSSTAILVEVYCAIENTGARVLRPCSGQVRLRTVVPPPSTEAFALSVE